MEQTIKINCPEGKKAIYNESTQSIDFVDIEPIRSKSWEEFCKNHPIKGEYYITNLCNIDLCKDSKRGYECDRNLFATKEDAEGILALIQLTRLHDEWVGDWTPKYNCVDEDKWNIIFIENTITIVSNTVEHRLLSFPERNLAQEFLNCFGDLIEKVKKFI